MLVCLGNLFDSFDDYTTTSFLEVRSGISNTLLNYWFAETVGFYWAGLYKITFNTLLSESSFHLRRAT